MPNRLASILATSAVALAAGAALAQSPPPATQAQAPKSVSPLTVEGKPNPKLIEKQAKTFVQSYFAAPNPEVDQIARWHGGVCVGVKGVSDDAVAAAIKARIESAALALKLPKPWKGANCKANVEIVFSNDPQGVMDEVALHHEQLLGYDHRGSRNQLKTVTHPIQAWYSTSTRSSAGAATAVARVFTVHLNPAGQPDQNRVMSPPTQTVDDPENDLPGPGGCPFTAFSCGLESDFNHVFIVVDAKALEGMAPASLADYLVMLALSQPKDLDGCYVLPSVLDLLAKSPCAFHDPPDGLTASDSAYLSALYASDPEQGKLGEVDDISGRMAKLLIKGATPGPSVSQRSIQVAQTQPVHTPPAQTPPAQTDAAATPVSPLTVQGMSKAELKKQAQAFAEAYGAPTKKLGLLAKWNDPACVAVTGLVAAQASEFKTRIEAVAKEVRAPVGGPKCAPNIEIVFTNQPQRVLDVAVGRSPAILGDQGEKTVTRPIQAWYTTGDAGLGPRSAGPLDDEPPPARAEEMIGRVAGDRFSVTRGAAQARRCVDPGVASHNKKLDESAYGFLPFGNESCPHSLFLNVLVVVDVAHMGDVSVDLTADYLALLALSQPKPRSLDGCLALPSVLDLYAKDCADRDEPTGLTAADRAYLTGLYGAELTQVKFGQGAQSDIAGRMVDILDSHKAPVR